MVGLLQLRILHDMQHIIHTAVLPGGNQILDQILAGVVSDSAAEVPGPGALDLAGLEIAGRRIGVVLVHLDTAVRHGEIQPAGDHLVTAVIPALVNPRPDGAGQVEFRQQRVIVQDVSRCVHEHGVQLVRGPLQLALGGGGQAQVLVAILLPTGQAVPAHHGDKGRLVGIGDIQPGALVLAVIFHVAERQIE